VKTILDKLSKSRRFRKAYTAALVAFGGPIGAALMAGTLTGGVALAAVGAGIVAFIAVYRVPNERKPKNEG
jgi:hypothetical protein